MLGNHEDCIRDRSSLVHSGSKWLDLALRVGLGLDEEGTEKVEMLFISSWKRALS